MRQASAEARSAELSNHMLTAGAGSSFDTVLERVGVTPRQWWLLFILGLGNAADAVEILSIGYILTVYPHISSEAKGALTAAVFAGMLIGGLACGYFSDRLGRRPLLLLSLVVNGFAALASAAAPTTGLLIAARVVAGLGVGGSVPSVFTMCAELFPASRRGFFINLVAWHWMVGSLFASTSAWLLLGVLGLSWRIYAAVSAAPALLTALLVVLFLPESPRFLHIHGRNGEAEAVLRGCARSALGPHPLACLLRVYPRYPSPTATHRLDDDCLDDSSSDSSSSSRQILPDVEPGAGATHSAAAVSVLLEDTPVRSSGRTLAQSFRALLLTKRHVALSLLLLLGVWFTLSFGSYGLLVWISELFKNEGVKMSVYQVRTPHTHTPTRRPARTR